MAVTAGRQALATYLLDKRTLLGGDLQDSTALDDTLAQDVSLELLITAYRFVFSVIEQGLRYGGGDVVAAKLVPVKAPESPV